jgi:hypothetical protein
MQVQNSYSHTSSNTISFMKLKKAACLAVEVLSLLLVPCMLTAIPMTAFAAQVILAWDEDTTGVTEGYELFARIEGEQYMYQDPIWTGTSTSATINNLEDNTSYYFVVRGVAGNNVSSDSNEVNYTTSTTASTSIQATSGDVDNVIIDNGGTGTSSTGSWELSGGSNPYGGESLYSKDNNAKYIYNSNLTGRYEVKLWWSSYSSRCSDVPVEIYNGRTLLDTMSINQRQNGGKWNVLGSYDFTGQARVVVSSQGNSCSTCADAAGFNSSTASNTTDTADNTTDTADNTTDTPDNTTDTADNTTGASSSTDNNSDSNGSQTTDSSSNTANNSATVIMDNGDQGTSTIGSWKTSGGSDPYGDESLWSKDVGASYSFTSPLTGRYDVALWWSSYSSRCSDVPVEIYDDDLLLDTISVNQSQNGGKWNVLGSYDFTGQAHVVVVASDNTCSTCADAVEFNIDVDSDTTTKTIDNGDPQTTSTGSWKVSGGSNPYGDESLWSKDVGASYSFTSPLTGLYEVALWWSSYSSRCSDVPVEIYDDDLLLDTISVNQRRNGGKWVVLGSYYFSGRARVTVVAQDSECSTCADAVSYSK